MKTARIQKITAVRCPHCKKIRQLGGPYGGHYITPLLGKVKKCSGCGKSFKTV